MRAHPGLVDDVDWRLCFLTDTSLTDPARLPLVVELAVRGGVGVVHLRDDRATDAEFRALVGACRAALDRAESATGRRAALFVHGRVDVAAEFGLHLHLGDPAGAPAARRALGPDHLLGVSIASHPELVAELADPHADVVVFAPLWSTWGRPDPAPPLGLAGVRRLLRDADGPVCLTGGGISLVNAREAYATGVAGIRVVSELATTPDPERRARELLAGHPRNRQRSSA